MSIFGNRMKGRRRHRHRALAVAAESLVANVCYSTCIDVPAFANCFSTIWLCHTVSGSPFIVAYPVRPSASQHQSIWQKQHRCEQVIRIRTHVCLFNCKLYNYIDIFLHLFIYTKNNSSCSAAGCMVCDTQRVNRVMASTQMNLNSINNQMILE